MPFFIQYSFVSIKKPADAGNIAGWFLIKRIVVGKQINKPRRKNNY
ncbi:hypothetical protein V5J73_08770 [Flavobacterium sp. KS-LB2]